MHVLVAAALALFVRPGAALPPALAPLQGVQGVDDDSMSSWAYTNDKASLTRRYAALKRDIQPGLRRYNFFWSSLEPLPFPASGVCPHGFELTPANETDRVARGYAHLHCYSTGTLQRFDDLFSRDAAIGTATGVIVYASPTWAQHENCTGFPWGSGPPFKDGCLPWGHTDDWEDFVLAIVERWHAPWGSGKARVSSLCIWNEVQSQGWSDPSPILPSRYEGVPYTPAQVGTYVDMLASLMTSAGRAAARHLGDTEWMLWLSTDHFTTAPPLHVGDVAHLGLYDILPLLWDRIGVTVPWGIAVHPYDAGDPRANLTSRGIYTFATLAENVASYQCAQLTRVHGVPPSQCGSWPQVYMWASEQGWPFNAKTMPKAAQARNICFAHALSVAQGVWSVTHNFFQGEAASSQGGGGDFSLIDEPPLVTADLHNASGTPTYDAYTSTSPALWGRSSTHYCCSKWAVGCAAEAI